MGKSKTKSRPALTKSSFVRSLPGKMPAREVVAKAKEKGLTLSEKLVYAIRSDDRARAHKTSASRAGAKKSSTKAANGAAKSSVRAHSSAEYLLLAIAAKVGLTRAIELLVAEDRKVSAALSAR